MTRPGGQSRRFEPEFELELVVAAESGDVRARADLVTAFAPAIAAMARRYRHGGMVEQEDLRQGVVGLLRAALLLPVVVVETHARVRGAALT